MSGSAVDNLIHPPDPEDKLVNWDVCFLSALLTVPGGREMLAMEVFNYE